MDEGAGRIGNVTVLQVGKELTSVTVRTEYGREIATLEVYNDDPASVYASTKRHDRLNVQQAFRVLTKARAVERVFDDYDAEPDEAGLRAVRNAVAELRYAVNNRSEPVAANTA